MQALVTSNKQLFMNGRPDNPMTSMISWPQVPGHEVVGEVVRDYRDAFMTCYDQGKSGPVKDKYSDN